MTRTRSKDSAREFCRIAAEGGETCCYGFCVLDVWYYTGGRETLESIGCIDIVEGK